MLQEHQSNYRRIFSRGRRALFYDINLKFVQLIKNKHQGLSSEANNFLDSQEILRIS